MCKVVKHKTCFNGIADLVEIITRDLCIGYKSLNAMLQLRVNIT